MRFVLVNPKINCESNNCVGPTRTILHHTHKFISVKLEKFAIQILTVKPDLWCTPRAVLCEQMSSSPILVVFVDLLFGAFDVVCKL